MYELVIVGAGPAGLTACIYALRAGVKTLVLERHLPGGQILLSHLIENYPGFPDPISPATLMEKIKVQTERLGMELKNSELIKIELEGERKILHLQEGRIKSLSVILAMGAGPRRLGVKGEGKFLGRGISYCAICDAPFFKDAEVVVVGGGNTALQESLYLARFVRRIKLLHRRGRLRGEKILQERVFRESKIEPVWNCVLEEIKGKDKVEEVKVRNLKTGKVESFSCEGVFIFVGIKPNSEPVRGLVDLDAEGFIKTKENLETNIPGVFACGDVRKNLLKQVVVACGEGAVAAHSARKYLDRLRGKEYPDLFPEEHIV